MKKDMFIVKKKIQKSEKHREAYDSGTIYTHHGNSL